ncbi:nectin-3 [Ambystoma mexicanum]|uniref:nectin-3 n=1 Tax=Ambystoma mexicanum TaxID=8296 RepID=UPI0037E886F1
MSAWRNPHEELQTNVRCRDDTGASQQSLLMDSSSSHLGINVSAREGCSKLATKNSSMAPGADKVQMVKKVRRKEPSTNPQYFLRDSSVAKVMDGMMMANLTNLKDQPTHPHHRERDWVHMMSSVCPCSIAQSSKLDIHRRQALKQSCDATAQATIKALRKDPSTHPQHVLSSPATKKVLLKGRGVNPTIANQRQAKHPLPVSLLAMTLLLYKVCGALGGRIVVDSHVTAVWGKNATLRCIFEDRENITQISWEKISTSALTVAVHHPVYGISIPGGYKGRAAFKSQSLHDATLVISNIGFSDAGHYICKAATFPLGNAQEKIKVDVIVEPTVSIRKGSTPLIDEGNMTVAATCTAANGKPAAIVGWEGGLGQAELTNSSSHNNTVTVVSQYKMIPTRFAQGRTITCVVNHPAFEKEVRYPYILDIKYAPEVSVTGHDEKWYVGGENLQLRCNADANPPPSEFAWSRLDGEWPDGLLPLNNTLLFNGLLTYNHSGVYVCKVTNALGERSGQKSIRIFDPPTTPTAAPTVPRLQETTATIASTLSKKGFFPASTMEVRYGDNLGTVIGSTVGGALLVVLLIVVAGVLCYRRRQTFRGDYFTKNYIPPSGMQKESQLDVLQTGNMDPYPETLAKEHPMNNLIMNERMGSLQKPNWNSVDTYNSRYQEQFARPQGYFEGIKPPVASKPSHDGAYDDNDEDFVSHFDGSVISRKEWYV